MAGLGLVQPSGMVRGIFLGQEALHDGTGDQAFQLKQGQDSGFSSFLLPEPGKFSPRLTRIMESFNLSNLNGVFKKIRG